MPSAKRHMQNRSSAKKSLSPAKGSIWADAYRQGQLEQCERQARDGVEHEEAAGPSWQASQAKSSPILPRTLPTQLHQLARVGRERVVLPSITPVTATNSPSDGLSASPLLGAGIQSVCIGTPTTDMVVDVAGRHGSPRQSRPRPSATKGQRAAKGHWQRAREERAFARALQRMEIGLFASGNAHAGTLGGGGDASVLAQLYMAMSSSRTQQRRRQFEKEQRKLAKGGGSRRRQRQLALERQADEIALRVSLACGAMDRLLAAPPLQPFQPALKLVRNALFRAVFAGEDGTIMGSAQKDEEERTGPGLNEFNGSYTQRITYAELALRGGGGGGGGGVGRGSRGVDEVGRLIRDWRAMSTGELRAQLMLQLVLDGSAHIVDQCSAVEAAHAGVTSSIRQAHAKQQGQPAEQQEPVAAAVAMSWDGLQAAARAIDRAIVAMSHTGLDSDLTADATGETDAAHGETATLVPEPGSRQETDGTALLEQLRPPCDMAWATSVGAREVKLPSSVAMMNAVTQEELLSELLLHHALAGTSTLALPEEHDAVEEWRRAMVLQLEPLRLVCAGAGCLLAASGEQRDAMRMSLLADLCVEGGAVDSDIALPAAERRARAAANARRVRGAAIVNRNATALQLAEQQMATHALGTLSALVRAAQRRADDEDHPADINDDISEGEEEGEAAAIEGKERVSRKRARFGGAELTAPQLACLATLLGALSAHDAQHVMGAIANALATSSKLHHRHVHHHDELHRQAIVHRATGRDSSVPHAMGREVFGLRRGSSIDGASRPNSSSDSAALLSSTRRMARRDSAANILSLTKQMATDDLPPLEEDVSTDTANTTDAGAAAVDDATLLAAKAAEQHESSVRAAAAAIDSDLSLDERIAKLLTKLQGDGDAMSSMLQSLLTMISGADHATSEAVSEVLYDLTCNGTLRAEHLEGVDRGRAEADPIGNATRLAGEVAEALGPCSDSASATVLLELLGASLDDEMLSRLVGMHVTEQALKRRQKPGAQAEEVGSCEAAAAAALVTQMPATERAALLAGLCDAEAADGAIAETLRGGGAAEGTVSKLAEQVEKLQASLIEAAGGGSSDASEVRDVGTSMEPGDMPSGTEIATDEAGADTSVAATTAIEDPSLSGDQSKEKPERKEKKKKKKGDGLSTASSRKGGTKDLDWTIGMAMALFEEAIKLNFLEHLDDSSHPTFDEFAAASFVRQFGVKSLARKKINVLMKAVRTHEAESAVLRALLSFIAPPSLEQKCRIRFLLEALIAFESELVRNPIFPPDPKSKTSSWISLERVHCLLPIWFPGRISSPDAARENLFTQGVKGKLEHNRERGMLDSWRLPRHKGYQLARTWRVHKERLLEVLLGAKNEDSAAVADIMDHVIGSLVIAPGAARAAPDDATGESNHGLGRDMCEKLFKIIAPNIESTLQPRFALTNAREFTELVRVAGAHIELSVFVAFMDAAGIGIAPQREDGSAGAVEMHTLKELSERKYLLPKDCCVLIDDLGFHVTEAQLAAMDDDGDGRVSWMEFSRCPVWNEITASAHKHHVDGESKEASAMAKAKASKMKHSLKTLSKVGLSSLAFTAGSTSFEMKVDSHQSVEEEKPPGSDAHQVEQGAMLGVADIVAEQEAGDQEEMNMLALQLHPMFRDLGEAERHVVLDVMAVRVVAPGAVVIREGDKGNSMFVLKQGVAAVRVAAVAPDPNAPGADAALDTLGKEVAELQEPDFFGELALTEADSCRTASIVAKSACELLEFPRSGFEHLVATCPAFKQALADSTDALAMVKEVPLFKNLPLKIAQEILALCKKCSYGRGELVIEQGDEADCMFFIKSGTVNVALKNLGKVATMGPGQFFGERALFEDDQDVRTASVFASDKGDVHLLMLEKDDFIVLLEDFPAFAREVDSMSGNLSYIDD